MRGIQSERCEDGTSAAAKRPSAPVFVPIEGNEAFSARNDPPPAPRKALRYRPSILGSVHPSASAAVSQSRQAGRARIASM